MSSSFATWKDKLLFWTITGLVVSGAGWLSWATLAILERPTAIDVAHTIELQSPYIEDRQFIRDRLEQSKSVEKKLIEVIEKNTTAINALSVVVAKLGASR